MSTQWHAEDLQSLISKLSTNPELGLTESEAHRRLDKYGANELEKTKKKHPMFLFLEQFTDPLVIILLLALLISIIIGALSTNPIEQIEYAIDALAISTIVLFNALFGFIQEYKAERAIEALKLMAAPTTTVIRDGTKLRIDANTLVPGDVIVIEEGDKIPADSRLIQAHSLRVDESALTGESYPVVKKVGSNINPQTPVAERWNCVFSGTNITRGRAHAIVTQTGMRTEFGRIALGLLVTQEEETPLQLRMEELGKWIGIGSLTICFIIFIFGILLNQEVIEMFIVAVGLAVAAVPEGLPAVVTLALALGVQRMSKKNAIIRRLPSVETLGSTTVICSDKTGTLTKNEMTARRILTVEDEYDISDSLVLDDSIKKILSIGVECNNAQLANLGQKSVRVSSPSTSEIRINTDIGDPTELALLKLGASYEVYPQFERLYEIPFDSTSKRMSVVVKNDNNEFLVFTKGAPEILINLCEYYLFGGEIKTLNDTVRKHLEEKEQQNAIKGYRMLGMAYKTLEPDVAEREILSEDTEEIESRLIYVGSVAIMDPPREGTKEAIDTCKIAGIRPLMITGDHLKTALAIAIEIGLVESQGSAKYIEGAQLAEMSDDQLSKSVLDINVFARVSPEHKLKLISALKSNNQVVAMTGDGVNDAPALKRADIGVAMGISGTDVSKEASDMVLADDDFSTIVRAIREGRTIYDNMRKFILYLLSCNAGEIAVMFFGMLLTTIIFGEPALPLLAIQILWVNLVTDGLPALAMGVDPPDSDIMIRQPRDPKESILTRKSIYFILYSGIAIGLGTLFIFFLYLTPNLASGQAPDTHALLRSRTAAFTLLIMFQMVMALQIRKEEHSLFGRELIRNPYLLLAVFSSIGLHLIIMYLPILQPIFETTSLGIGDWVIVISIASLLIVTDEIRIFLAKRVPRFKNLGGYW
ncbi:MAG: calcium-translocating P-type ATPase, PMCA-type [Candidatus Heimdallarchaeota archaeon]